MKILSFDVGSKNLAYTVIDSNESIKILNWNIIDISVTKRENECVQLVNKLDEIPSILLSDVVLIEKQPSKNNKMRIIEGLLNAYFVIKGVTNEYSSISKVIVYSAKHKLGKDTFKGKMNYLQRKKLGVFRCEKFLQQIKQPDEIHETFVSSRKKDDLADCLLQALSYIEFNIEADNNEFNVVEKVISRKPSKKQERNRYSKCNIKWFLNNLQKQYNSKDLIFVNIESNLKLKNAIIYWYKSIDNAYEILLK